MIKNYRNTETKECTFIPNKDKKSKSKSKILNKAKPKAKNDSDEEGPIYEKLYKMHRDKEIKIKTLNIEKELEMKKIYTFTPYLIKSEKDEGPKRGKSEFFERVKR